MRKAGRFLSLGVSFLAGFLLPIAPSRPARAASGGVSEDLRAALSWVQKGEPYESWAKEHPESDCRVFEGKSFAYSPEQAWCNLCERKSAESLATYGFYFDPAQNACTLQQFSARWEKDDANDSKIVQKTVAEILGPAVPAKGKQSSDGFMSWEDVSEFGSADWLNVMVWRTKQDLAYSYSLNKQFAEQPSGLGFIWRWEPLRSRTGLSLKETEQRGADKRAPQTALNVKACRETGESNCEALAEALEDGKTLPETDAVLERAVERLNRMNASDSHYPALAYWTTRLLPDCIANKKQLEFVQHLGLKMGDDPLGGCSVPENPWLETLATKRLDSFWGRRAFLEYLKRGWTDKTRCADGAETFRRVIERGEDFLKRYPNADVSPAVVLELARAYETWWSVAVASSNDPYATHPSDSEQARLKAVDYYKAYLKSADDAEIREKVYRLGRKIDTAQRAYFCIYD